MAGSWELVADTQLTPYRDVGDHAALARAGLFVAEGRLVVERLLVDRRFRIHSVVVTPAAAAALAPAFAAQPEVPVVVCEPAVLEAITGFDFHRGCLALGWRQESQVTFDELCAARCVLALEGIGNPDNVGGLFRTALALGAGAILLDPATADPLYRKAIRTSMGATLRVPYARATAWPAELDALRARGFRTIALTPQPDAIAIDDVRMEPASRVVLLAGSEGPGLTPETMARADVRVRIPIDPRADSLNVVVATAMALKALST